MHGPAQKKSSRRQPSTSRRRSQPRSSPNTAIFGGGAERTVVPRRGAWAALPIEPGCIASFEPTKQPPCRSVDQLFEILRGEAEATCPVERDVAVRECPHLQ